MSDNAGSNVTPPAAGSGESDETKGTVAYASHQKLLDQHKAGQAALREANAKLAAVEAAAAEAETKRLAEQQEFKTLWEKEQKARTEAETKLSDMTTRQVESAKKTALKDALGGAIKPEYLKFANLDAIQLNDDGVADPDSVKAVAAEFRKNHPELIPTKAAPALPNEAGKGLPPAQPKDPSQMTPTERSAALKVALAAGRK